MRYRVKRRLRRRIAPKVRRCACAGARAGAKERLAETGGLMIGGAKDPAEKAVDARAARALATAPTLHRKCAACEAQDTAQRSPAAGVLAPGAAAAPASQRAQKALDALGPGRPLSFAERGFYEPRLGADLAPVRLHENAAADKAARAIDASAFTLGTDIAFARGERARGGARLMAHELAHVAEDAPAIRRKLRVKRPNWPIPRPGGKGVKRTNGKTVERYLDEISEFSSVKVKNTGEVSFGMEICGLFRGLVSRGYDCICDLVNSKHKWTIEIRDTPAKDAWPHFESVLPGAANKKGAGGEIVVPSPNEKLEIGTARKSGAIMAEEPWESLLHELCGHARLADKGEHPVPNKKKLRHGHTKVVGEVNKILADRMDKIPLRGNRIQDPYCGESFSREKGTTEWIPGAEFAKCAPLREKYLKDMQRKHPNDPKYKKKYDLSDKLP